MKRSIGSLLLGTALLAGIAGLIALSSSPSPVQATAQKESDKVAWPVAAAKQLKIHLGTFAGKSEELLDSTGKAWELAQPTRVLLNRTPRIYQTEKVRPTRPTMLEVRALRIGQGVCFRLTWEDATRNDPEAPPRRKGDVGDPAKLYKRPTGTTTAFADAVALMVPQSAGQGEFPSLVMGDVSAAVRLYYWNASRGAEQLNAAGRARVEGTGKSFAHRARHDSGRWAVTMEIPEMAAPVPVAFATWDGELGDRNGSKTFSIWYVLE